jgi:hypothetical protein
MPAREALPFGCRSKPQTSPQPTLQFDDIAFDNAKIDNTESVEATR